jgi:hypothetical protein
MLYLNNVNTMTGFWERVNYGTIGSSLETEA